MELQNSTVLVTGPTGNGGPSATESLDELDARVTTIGRYLIDVPANREAIPEGDFSEWTISEAILDEVLRLHSTERVTGQIQMTGGQSEVVA